MRSPTPCSLAATLFLALAGCAYVNIPPQQGDLAWHDPNNQTVREVLTRTLKAVLDEQPIEGRFVVLMPDGSSAEPYINLNRVLENYDPKAWKQVLITDATPAIHIKQIRIRASEAQVDLVRETNPTQPDPHNQLITTQLYWQAPDGWFAHRVRRWWPGSVTEAPPPAQTTDQPSASLP